MCLRMEPSRRRRNGIRKQNRWSQVPPGHRDRTGSAVPALMSVSVALRTLLIGPVLSKHSAGPEPATHSTTSRQLRLYFQAKRHRPPHMTFPKKALRPEPAPIALYDSTIEELKQYEV